MFFSYLLASSDQHLEELHNNQAKPALSLSIKSKHREILLREKRSIY
ncbi:hypothetical protein NEOC65_000349 [Neochlamydia sp. AcF65]|nr:hypothetical protein [Neochlamydia sp. AcF65]MBS4171111.1 hypothetical protein [Neochlamydia sp. AcF95]